MKADFFYSSAAGRGIFRVLQAVGVFKPVAWYLHTRVSAHLIPGYIKKNKINMRPYGIRDYDSFADFFGRKREYLDFEIEPDVLIAPCDSLLSVYDISPDLEIPMKGSLYTLPDLIPDKEVTEKFRDGLCLVFRLEASDYHHFCFFDSGTMGKVSFIEGQLHSVQPIALRQFPVFRLNRRWWSVLETKHFGTAAQIEIGAMAVGGVTFAEGKETFNRGEEMGNFELAGSTIVLLLTADVKKRLELDRKIKQAYYRGNGSHTCDSDAEEVRVTIGSALGCLKNED
ncbi:MAG: phosphatidylserine decarboxylase [Lachnospiraceae bacterium]|nr:phosphatidylserine decarboxylase [Lachnospiraceae bacterium]